MKFLKKHKKLIDNFFSLVILNIVNYVFPIIIIPILMKRLGVEFYGKYIFVFTILSYLNLIVQYGFNFSATNKIAKNQNNIEIINDTYTSITFIRVMFSILITLCILMIGIFIGNSIILYLLGIGIFLGQGLIPIWLFQGLEKMKFITIVNTIVRLFAFIIIYFFIQTSDDVNNLMLIQSISFILGGVASLILVKYQLKINLITLNINSIKSNLKEGYSLFLSTVGMNLYRESNVVILGLIAGYSTVGLYSPAEKLVKGIQSFSNIIVTVLYPHFSKKMNNNKVIGINSFMRVGKALSLFFVFVTFLMFILSTEIIDLFIGKGYHATIIDFRILSLVILFGGLNYYYGIVGLVNFNKQDVFNKLVWISGIIGISMCVCLTFLWKDKGAAIAMVVAEIILLLMILIKLKK